MSNNIVRSTINGASFSIYTDDEKKNQLSVVQIQSLESVDQEGKPIPG